MTEIKENIEQLYKEILQWNVFAWSNCMKLWHSKIMHSENNANSKVLEIGARDGGLSLFYALNNLNVTCSDIREQTEDCKNLFKKYNLQSKIEYAQCDATKIPYPNDHFDIVVFKSVLGGIAYHRGLSGLATTFNEIYRVLKPGGQLHFAENLEGCILHSTLRKYFIRNRGPDNTWRYLTKTEIQDLLRIFEIESIYYYGFFSPLGRTETQKEKLNKIDSLINPIVPDKYKHICYGVATKRLH